MDVVERTLNEKENRRLWTRCTSSSQLYEVCSPNSFLTEQEPSLSLCFTDRIGIYCAPMSIFGVQRKWKI